MTYNSWSLLVEDSGRCYVAAGIMFFAVVEMDCMLFFHERSLEIMRTRYFDDGKLSRICSLML